MSFPFVTVIVAAGVSVALNKSAAIAQAALILLFCFHFFLRPFSGNSSIKLNPIRLRRAAPILGITVQVLVNLRSF